MQNSELQKDEIQALLDASTALGIPATSLKPVNPFRHDLKTPTAQSIQLWLRENRPEIAARLSGNSGHIFSLAATAAEMGLREHDAKSHEEMMQHSEVYARQKNAEAADWEARMLKEMEQKSMELATARGVDPDAVNQKYNPAMAGKFQSYFEALNADAALEHKMQQG